MRSGAIHSTLYLNEIRKFTKPTISWVSLVQCGKISLAFSLVCGCGNVEKCKRIIGCNGC